MDTLGNTVCIRHNQHQGLLKALAAGYRRIYLRGPAQTRTRRSTHQWVSPFPPTPPYFVHTQHGRHIAGRLGRCYYNPRYATDRHSVSSLLDRPRARTLRIIGGGTGAYALYLHRLYPRIRSYDINPQCAGFGFFNCGLNRVEGVRFFGRMRHHKGQDDVLCMIPHWPIERHLRHKFAINLVFYVLLASQTVNDCRRRVEQAYGIGFRVCRVRSYARGLDIFRFQGSRLDESDHLS